MLRKITRLPPWIGKSERFLVRELEQCLAALRQISSNAVLPFTTPLIRAPNAQPSESIKSETRLHESRRERCAPLMAGLCILQPPCCLITGLDSAVGWCEAWGAQFRTVRTDRRTHPQTEALRGADHRITGMVKTNHESKLKSTVMSKSMVSDMIVRRSGQLPKEYISVTIHTLQTNEKHCRAGKQPKGSNEIGVGPSAVV